MATSSMSTAESQPASEGVAIVAMGVSGAGKTTVGKLLAEALDGVFVDGDDQHTDAARAKMGSGQALTDEDRWPWLDRIGAALADGLRERRRIIVACSALKLAYRNRLRASAGPRLRFVYLSAEPQAIQRRVGSRKGHYMPASLVTSQFAALEPPVAELDVFKVSAEANLRRAIPRLAAALGGRSQCGKALT
jgi:gluconokinase